MAPFVSIISNEIAENWPAFVYVGLTIGISVCFFRERRSETRMLKEAGEILNEPIRVRFDRLEQLIHDSYDQTAAANSRSPSLVGGPLDPKANTASHSYVREFP